MQRDGLGPDGGPVTRLAAARDTYEHAVSLGSMSKVHGLPGLRLRWLTSRDAEILRRCRELRLYTTICNSAPRDFLSAVALRHRDVMVKRNLEIVRKNLALLDAFFVRRSLRGAAIFSNWVCAFQAGAGCSGVSR